MGVPSGGNLGTASGRIVINTAGVRAAQREVQSASKVMTQVLGAIGISATAHGFVQLARSAAAFGVEADKVATAYRRQSVAALGLAGSQAKLNDLLRVYESVTGGAVDNATALNDVTRLMAVGFADTTAELEQFVRAARGISVATGQQQDYVISQLQLAIANQSTLRLDQLGLGVSEVTQRIDELRAANSNLTKEMAYQQAILELAEKKFGALVDSAEAGATGVEEFTTAWKNFRLEVGKSVEGPFDAIGAGAALFLELQTVKLRAWIAELDVYIKLFRQLNIPAPFLPTLTSFERGLVSGSATVDDSQTGLRRPRPAGPRFDQDQTAALRDWAAEVKDIERQAANDRIQATQQYEQQRTQVIRDYEKQIARDAEDGLKVNRFAM